MNYADPSQWHEAANLFPMLPDAELAELAEDIKSNGLLNPVVLHEGKVLDGRNRLMACQRAGVAPTFKEWQADGISPVAWVISQNVMRRQMTPGQRAAVAVEAKPLLEAEARKNQLAHLKQGTNSRSVKVDETGKTTPIDVRKTVARQFDVSEGYVHEAQKIKVKDEAVFSELKAGTVTLPEAKRKVGGARQASESEKESGAEFLNHYGPPNTFFESEQIQRGGSEYRYAVTITWGGGPSALSMTVTNIFDTADTDEPFTKGIDEKWTDDVFQNLRRHLKAIKLLTPGLEESIEHAIQAEREDRRQYPRKYRKPA